MGGAGLVSSVMSTSGKTEIDQLLSPSGRRRAGYNQTATGQVLSQPNHSYEKVEAAKSLTLYLQ
jgi:hypothetical protein